MKGQHSLFDKVVKNSLEDLRHDRKNRDRRLDALAHRFYYYASLCRLRYDDCVLALHIEFYLEPDTIYLYLKSRDAMVNTLVQSKTSTQDLKKRYPHFDWSGRPVLVY